MTEAAIALRGPSVAMNPWLVAAAVVVPTFMEVLDTTIAGRAALYRRRAVGDGQRRRMGSHELPRRQRHYPADHRLVEQPLRPPRLLPRVDRCIYGSFGAVRDGNEP